MKLKMMSGISLLQKSIQRKEVLCFHMIETKNMLERIHKEAEIMLNIESKYIVKSYSFDENDK